MTTARRTESGHRLITIARVLLAMIAVSHVTVPLVMLARRAALQDEIRDHHHNFTAAQLARSASVAIDAAVGFHAILAVLCLILIVTLPSQRRRILRLTIVSQVAAIVFSALSWSQSSMFHALIPVVDALSLAVIVCVAVAWSRPSSEPSRRGLPHQAMSR